MWHKPDINSIISSLHEKGILNNVDIVMNNKTGTTDGLVYILSEHNEVKYVLKIDHPQQITLSEQFLYTYRHIGLVPTIIYTDPEKAYIVYSYIAGTTHYNRGLKIDWLTLLVKRFFNHYEKSLLTDQWGRLHKPIHSWREWNYRSLQDTRNNWGNLLSIEDYNRVKSIAEHISACEEHEARFLLHGDAGVHNFVFHDNSLIGVIDPSPMIGPVLYDFTYAFCSSPDDLNLETLIAAYSSLNYEPVERSRLIKEVIFQLYCRIGICIQHHPHDLEDYLKAWEYWKSLQKEAQ
ncbi:aminoglycoside phosphotransferase family protein [Paenibacillus periandrae]|uniref:aminoglycoside phosphotransferase family protein n=1 Tax=Paenibacillus periandrae TaxID=1761741 RepID=UPI001F0963F9|nr:aminoglycoside phosphotransferase family protein [Paenibacillus periandrae]